MILNGSQRSGAYDLARHLLKEENDRVEVHELRGFVAHDLIGAFQESYAISRATRCKQHLYSLSLSPPPDAEVSNADFEMAIGRTEEKLGLQGQPRAIVFHVKNGRRHAHAVWCRIDADEMKARQLSYDHSKLKEVSRELFIEHGWRMPRGLVRPEERNPRNYTLAEWQQAKRAGKDVEQLKVMFQDCWAISDGRTAFAHALAERGYVLARGDRRGFIAVDHQGEAYAISKYVGVKAKEVRERLGDPAENLPTKNEAHAVAAKQVTDRLEELKAEQRAAAARKLNQVREKKIRLLAQQARDAGILRETQAKRQLQESAERATRIRTGAMGVWDWLTGRRKRILQKNQQESAATEKRYQRERKEQAWLQEQARKALTQTAKAEARRYMDTGKELDLDAVQVKASVEAAREERQTERDHQRSPRERPKRRSRARDGPGRER